jgi:hypothetical protein
MGERVEGESEKYTGFGRRGPPFQEVFWVHPRKRISGSYEKGLTDHQ